MLLLISLSGGLINHLQTTYLHPGIVSMRVAFVLRAAEIFPWFLRFVLPKFAEISLSRFSLWELISNYDVETNFLGWKFERYGRQKTCAQIKDFNRALSNL